MVRVLHRFAKIGEGPCFGSPVASRLCGGEHVLVVRSLALLQHLE